MVAPNYLFPFLISLFLMVGCTADQVSSEKPLERPPNVVLILADDLGYGDLGVYGQEYIETPNIDALARNGMLFSQHYSGAPVCAPARYMIMTGKHAGHAYIRGNNEWRERGEVWDYIAMAKDSSLEGQYPIPDSTLLLSGRLQSKGYATAIVGKWGLGAPHTSAIPNRMGFDYFCGYNCQRQAHTLYPLHLYENENRLHLANDTVPPGTKLAEGADPTVAESYAPFNQTDYAPTVMFNRLTKWVAERDTTQPFFLYWATPIPHLPLQAPDRWVKYYEEKFGPEEPYLGQKGYFPHPSPKAAYAAMISYLDENVGKLVEQLKRQGVLDNTLILFTSDNGPSYTGGTDSDWFSSAGPLATGLPEENRIKGTLYEGGIRVPLIAHWPGKIAPGGRSDLVSAHYDLTATINHLAGGEALGPGDGLSLLPTLLDSGEQAKHEVFLWEQPAYGGQVALRYGDWKLIRRELNNDKKPATLELYDLSNDPRETDNVADQHPEIVQQISALFEREHRTAYEDRFRIPAIENGLLP